MSMGIGKDKDGIQCTYFSQQGNRISSCIRTVVQNSLVYMLVIQKYNDWRGRIVFGIEMDI